MYPDETLWEQGNEWETVNLLIDVLGINWFHAGAHRGWGWLIFILW